MARRNKSSQRITIHVPKAWLPLIEGAVAHLDTDRSKFVRNAVKEKMQKLGLGV